MDFTETRVFLPEQRFQTMSVIALDIKIVTLVQNCLKLLGRGGVNLICATRLATPQRTTGLSRLGVLTGQSSYGHGDASACSDLVFPVLVVEPANICKGVPFAPPQQSSILVINVLELGWGSSVNSASYSGPLVLSGSKSLYKSRGTWGHPFRLRGSFHISRGGICWYS